MRSLEFKAWDKKKKKMIFSDTERCLRSLSDIKGDENWKSPIGFFPEMDGQIFEVLQYTGRKINNVELYEDDLIQVTETTIVNKKRCKHISIYRVVWSDNALSWGVVNVKLLKNKSKAEPVSLAVFLLLRSNKRRFSVKILGSIFEKAKLRRKK